MSGGRAWPSKAAHCMVPGARVGWGEVPRSAFRARAQGPAFFPRSTSSTPASGTISWEPRCLEREWLWGHLGPKPWHCVGDFHSLQTSGRWRAPPPLCGSCHTTLPREPVELQCTSRVRAAASEAKVLVVLRG